ncbi:MAG: copper uptake system-associated protein [Rhodobacterales bacterium]|nr:copper uptake system-associated protein [Rhodobacterales bacterium]
MNRLLTLVAAIFLTVPAFLAVPAVAHEITVGDLQIIHPHIPQPAASAKAAGGFMAIVNNGTEPDRLIGIESDIAAKSEVHESKVDAAGIGTMTHVDALEIPAGQTVSLEHGGYHIMFMGLTGTLTEGEMYKATLIFERTGRVEIEFMIDPPTGEGEMDHSKMDHSKMDHSADGDAAHGDHAAAAPAMTGDPLVDIEALLKAQFDTPENPLTVAPITVQGDVAIAGWSQNGMGGRAFLRQDDKGWFVELCAGKGLLMPEMLTGLGLADADAASLLAGVTTAEAALGPDAIALFDSFDGELFIGRDGQGHEHGAATN